MTASNTPASNKIVTKTEIVDNVLRFPPSGMKIIIVGAGPAGLLTAIECWRKGHNVEVLEKSPTFSSIGDIITIGPSAWSTLHNYPSMVKEYVDVGIDAVITPCYLDGRHAMTPFEPEFNQKGVAEHVAYPLRVVGINGRADLATILLNQCKRLDIPITWGISITDYEDDTSNGCGVAISDDGKRYQADVIVPADGIGSKSHKLILGEPVRPVGTGYTIYRAAMSPAELLHDTPVIKQHLATAERPEARLYLGQNRHLVAIVSHRLVSFAITLPDDALGKAQESWSSTITSQELLDKIPDSENLDPLMVEIIKNFPDNRIVAWKLCMRNPQPKWSSEGGHVVQAGDSAHSFIPTSANGATMAFEDAISLAECLRLGGKNGIQSAVKTYHLLRHQRTALIQRLGILNRAAWHQDRADNVEQMDKLLPQGKWVWGHNAEKYVVDNFRQAREHIETGAPFENTNLPPGYKPEPWTLEGEVEKEKNGDVFDPRSNGDWCVY
ncbi:hypothetical protein F4781DRAFT_417159 [Annulohypoxylon bovei var. microspora]|nr:hypothetical protein F4781DRAFT_417159 [Annulohypoxylon bovei var. microspora]